jgi:hypothetical protein
MLAMTEMTAELSAVPFFMPSLWHPGFWDPVAGRSALLFVHDSIFRNCPAA